jgi:hypothetical protein
MTRRFRFRRVIREGLVVFAALALAACGRAAAVGPSPYPFPTIERDLTATADIQASVLQPDATSTPFVTAGPLQFLDSGQHISASGSYTETETEAAGPMICHVERGSCAYNYLVQIQIPGILFLDEESPPYRGEDHLVNAAMIPPLSTLADLVSAEWDGKYQVMVTDAYDSLLEHDLAQNDPNRKYSLHFEGRSIDLILVPLGLERLSRLCALAHQAGFDWVHNENDHCHASVQSDSLCDICSPKATP